MSVGLEWPATVSVLGGDATVCHLADTILVSLLTPRSRAHDGVRAGPGVRGFRADVLVCDTRMMRVFERASHRLSVKKNLRGIEEVTMLFTQPDTRSGISDERVVRESASPVAGWAGCRLLLGRGSMRRKEYGKWMSGASAG